MTPLERAARAIRPDLNWSSSLDDAFKRDAFARARAVLEAIRESADDLSGDAYRTIVYMKGESETLVAKAVFEKMIDAALGEG